MNMIRPIRGILNQMKSEARAAENVGIPWKSRVFGPSSEHGDICVEWKGETHSSGRSFKRSYYQWLERESSKVDLVVLRYTAYDPLQISWIRRSKKPVVLVFHTFDVEEVSRKGAFPKGWLQGLAERILGPMSIANASGLVAVTSEVLKYEQARVKDNHLQPSFVYPNGVDCSNTMPLVDDRKGSVPTILFVSSKFHSWHGLDLLISSVSRSDLELRIHLVGRLDSRHLKEIGSDSRFIVHGEVDSQKILELSRESWVGLASLAHSRLGMNEACPLKVREYLLGGLAVFGGYKEVFPEDFPYYRRGSVQIEDIVAYAVSMRKISKETVRESSLPWIEKRILLSRFYDFLVDSFERTQKNASIDSESKRIQ